MAIIHWFYIKSDRLGLLCLVSSWQVLYIPAHSVYQQVHQFHETLILGYDESTIYISDNLATGKYQITSCNSKEIENAFQNVITPLNYINHIIMLKPIQVNAYELYIDQIKDGLQRYLYSKPPFDPINHSVLSIFGFDVYKFLISRFEHY